MSRDQRHEIYDTLSDAWNRATSRIVEIKEEKRRKREEWLQRQEERKRKYEEWRERMESNIERWENNIEKAEEYISRLEEQIDRLEEDEANARTDEYARVFFITISFCFLSNLLVLLIYWYAASRGSIAYMVIVLLEASSNSILYLPTLIR